MEKTYFEHIHITKNVVRIKDILGVFCYLVIGNERAALIDTGNGFGNIKEYVERITDKEIFVILTHGHFDHINGVGLFENAYLNLMDLEIFKIQNDCSWRENTYANFSEVADVDISEYNPSFNGTFNALLDKQVFDLGNLTIQAIHVPGHTPGIMMILIKEERIMLFGDACGPGTLLFEEWATDISVFRRGLSQVKEYEYNYDRIIRNHGTGESDKYLLESVINCCDRILAGTDDKIETNIMGIPLLKAVRTDENGNRFDGYQGNVIYLPSKGK